MPVAHGEQHRISTAEELFLKQIILIYIWLSIRFFRKILWEQSVLIVHSK